MLTCRITEDLAIRLAKVGESEGLSQSDTIRLVLERGITASGIPPTTAKEEQAWRKRPVPNSGTRQVKKS